MSVNKNKKTGAPKVKSKKKLTRSETMRAVKSKNTKPELLVRSILKKQGVRFSTYAKLPGSPDIVIRKDKIAIRVMGCFWHGHKCKMGNRIPKTNIEYWTNKIARNKARDKENKRDLKKLGWCVVDVWGCSIKNRRTQELIKKIKFINEDKHASR